MFTFFCGRPEQVLEALEDQYSRSYEKLFRKKSSFVDMSRWVSLPALEELFSRAATVSGTEVPSLQASLSAQGWTRVDGDHRLACVVVANPLLRALAGVPKAAAEQAALAWAEALGPPVDELTRRPLRLRAEELFALARSCPDGQGIVVMEEGNELALQLATEQAAEGDEGASLSSDMAFLAGDAARIGAALEDENDLKLRRVLAASVDLSFHLDLEDVDALASVSDSIERCVAGDAGTPWHQREWSADVLRKEWVERWSALSAEQVDQLASAWAARFEDGADGQLAEAARSLAALCRKALEEDLDVIFSWRAG